MPEQPPAENRPEKKSRATALGHWIKTTRGQGILFVSVIALLAGAGAAVAITRAPHPASAGPTPAVSAHDVFAAAATSTQLTNALLPPSALGSAASVGLSGSNPSGIAGDCGGALNGAKATAYEELEDAQTGQDLSETITYWDGSADAAAAISSTRSAIDRSGSCSYSTNGITEHFAGDDAGSVPQECPGGQSLATQASIRADRLTGYQSSAQCGSFTVVIEVLASTGPVITQSTVDGYLSTAVAALQKTLTG